MADSPKIEIKINGTTTATFSEEGNVPAEGCICLQAHGGDPYEVLYKDLILEQIQ